ncbi:sulfotransferase [PVC group bacterium]|nr:sulfotransferase [PVC group bacterium]
MSKATTIEPLFLLSLPRSGSTLLQRILASHNSIHTTAEPWMLLPILAPLANTRMYAEYGYQDYNNAMHDLIHKLPQGRDSYRKHIRKLSTDIYRDLAPVNTRYFLDKTPRYALIVSELLSTFPNAKFICLWRNPLAVAGSMLKTWCNNNWKLYQFEIDLYEGLSNLLEAVETHPERIHTVCYENLVNSPQLHIDEICNYLDISFNESMLSEFKDISFQGGKGDQVGTKRYEVVSADSIDAWHHVLNSPIRKSWAKKYLNWIGNERIEFMGYDINILLSQIETIPSAFSLIPSDFIHSIYGGAYRYFPLNVLRSNLDKRRHHKRVFGIY